MFEICFDINGACKVWESTDSEFEAITNCINLSRKNQGIRVYVQDQNGKLLFECRSYQ